MRTNYFFNGTWIVQLIVGFGLFLCSLFIEYQVLIHFISPPSLAVLLCVTLEGGKVSAVIWHYYLGCLGSDAYPLTIRFSSLLFRFGLIVLSILCSMLFLTARLDRPNLEQAREKQLNDLTRRETVAEQKLNKEHRQMTASLLSYRDREIKQAEEQSGKTVQQLNALLLREMDNVVGGVFKGRRYRELELRLARAGEAASRELALLRRRHAHSLKQLQDKQHAETARLRADFARQRARVVRADFADDEQANDSRVIALLKTVQTMFHVKVKPLQFVFFFSILISLLMETGIMLAFATITTAIAPILHEHHIGELELEADRLRSESACAREETRHRSAMSRVRRTAENIYQEASVLDTSLPESGKPVS